jgi:mannan endo-1,4-beta-mannosidase
MPLSSGFVRRSGTNFELEGRSFKLVGANNYYLGYASQTMVEAIFALAVGLKLNVLRTWAFIDCDASVPGSTPPGSKNGVYFHFWNTDTGRPDFNDGPNGLERLDQVISLAETYGLRLILPFTNNWPDFGGIDQYLKWFGLHGHDQFFKNPEVKQAYRDYVQHLLTRVNTKTGRRYADEPAILAWELMNEPRCVDDEGSAVPGGVDTLIAWIEEMSAFVKGLDNNHLTCVGDEGFFRRSGAGANALYNGCHGVDSERILGVGSVDFGTCHLYPTFDPQEDAINFGQRWIREHIEAGQRASKPMLIEEYGYAINNEGQELNHRDMIFKLWLDQVLQSDGAGAALWMIASVMDNGQLYPDYDHYTVYAAEDVPSILSFSHTVGGSDVELQGAAGGPLPLPSP